MLNNLFVKITQNKNLIMLMTSAIYMLALAGVLYEKLFYIAIVFFIISIISIMKKYFPIKYIIIWNLLFFLGVINTSHRIKDVDELLSLAPVNSEITGTIVSIPQVVSDSRLKFFFNVDSIKFDSIEKAFDNEKVLVTLESNSKDLRIYDKLSLTGRLSPPFKAGNPSQFDYGNYLRNNSAYTVFYAKSYILLENAQALKSKILQKIGDYRENVLSIHSKFVQTPYIEILGGIVFGDDAVSPTKEIKQSFVNSGLLHILAASGMNVAFIYGFFFWILTRLKVNFRLSVILGMIMVLVYTFMTGLGASIIRATSMLMFVLIGKLIDRDAHSISLLSFVALLMLIFNPLFINDVGFQLSFIVTFGILLMTPAIVRFNNKVLDYIIGTITIPIIAQLWVIPIQIFYFSNISIYSIFANIMSVPVLAIISFGGFTSSLLAGIPPIAELICKSFDFILKPLLIILVNISDFWGHLPSATIQTAHPTLLQIIIYYLVLLSFTGLLYKEFREKYLKRILIIFITLIITWLITLISVKNTDLEITTFDVGNADCFLIKTPANKYIMIDSGKSGYKGGKSQAEIIVLKYFKDIGIKELDSLIITHFDNDHSGGALDLINNLKIAKIYLNDLKHKSKTANLIYNNSLKNNISTILAKNNQVVYNQNGLKITNLLGVSTDNDNENSIITLLEYNDFKMLFTGDASAKGINTVLDFVPSNIDVLKVPHHGANGGLDKKLVEYLNPKYSIISVGENKFGQPAFYILSLLKNSKILRTDIDNSILIKVEKEGYNIYTYDLKSKKYLLYND